MTDRTCQKCFAKFRAGDFSLEDAPQSSRPVEFDSNQTETIIENNQRFTTWEIADILKISKSRVESLGFPGGAVVKNPPANAGDMGSSPGPGRSHMPRSN